MPMHQGLVSSELLQGLGPKVTCFLGRFVFSFMVPKLAKETPLLAINRECWSLNKLLLSAYNNFRSKHPILQFESKSERNGRNN